VRLPPGFRIVSAETDFERRVAETVRMIPEGKLASYGRVADWVGRPSAARAVGSMLSRSPVDVPAHRVVTASGRLVPGWEDEQTQRLRAEGVRVHGGYVRHPVPWWEGPGQLCEDAGRRRVRRA
jgi:methylated-DNA-protein-cysteine methyltransferase related protein